MIKNIKFILILFLFCITELTYLAKTSYAGIAIVKIVYDGESLQTDANWENWWGTSSFVDQTDNKTNGSYGAEFNSIGVHSGGAHVPELSWWNGVDVSGADMFEFYFKAGVGEIVELALFDTNVQYSTTLNVTGTGNWEKIATNLSYFSNGQIDFKEFVGVQIGANAGVTAYFDDMFFTVNVEVKEEQAIPSFITNIQDNIVEFWVKARTANTQITNVTIDLSTLGGPANAKMTNQAGFTLFRYTFSVASNQTVGNYNLPVIAYDDKNCSGKGEVSLTITSDPPYICLPTLTIYDGGDETSDTDFYYVTGWQWGGAGFFDVTDSPLAGSYCGKFIMTNGTPGGIAHLRDSSWLGMDCSRADRLELWIRGTEDLSEDDGVEIRLFSTNTRYSASRRISLTPNWQKVDILVSYLTNTANGADANFTMEKFLGIEFSSADFTPGGTIVYFDNIALTARVLVSSEKANPEIIFYAADNDVNFTCSVEGIENISSVTLDLNPLAGGYGKIELLDTGGGIYSNIQLITGGSVNPGTYILPVTAYDISGNKGTGKLYITVSKSPAVILQIVYDGETQDTDANWENWWGTSQFVDQTSDVPSVGDTTAGEFTATGAHSGGSHVPTLAWWNGVDISQADTFEFLYKTDPGDNVELVLFSYAGIIGNSTTLYLPASVSWVKVATNMSYFLNGVFDPKYFVGLQIGGESGTTAYFDDIMFTANILVEEDKVVPSVISNTKNNIVEFWVKARTSQGAITNVTLDLSVIGGPANARMTNISGWTSFRYTYEVSAGQLVGYYRLPVIAYNDQADSGQGYVVLQIISKSVYTTAIVYDGDTVPARPDQWSPLPLFPQTGIFEDVTDNPHDGNLCGRYYQTNAGGTVTFHDPGAGTVDVSMASKLEIWARGENGGEAITLTFVFLDVNRNQTMSQTKTLNLTQNWGQWIFDLYSEIADVDTVSNLNRFSGMLIENVALGDTIYLDDIKFLNYVKIEDEMADPDLVSADSDNSVDFSCFAFTLNNNLTSVQLDLSSVGGGAAVNMTDADGGNTNWFHNYIVPSGTTPGFKQIKATATDDAGYAAVAYIPLLVVGNVRFVTNNENYKKLDVFIYWSASEHSEWIGSDNAYTIAENISKILKDTGITAAVGNAAEHLAYITDHPCGIVVNTLDTPPDDVWANGPDDPLEVWVENGGILAQFGDFPFWNTSGAGSPGYAGHINFFDVPSNLIERYWNLTLSWVPNQKGYYYMPDAHSYSFPNANIRPFLLDRLTANGFTWERFDTNVMWGGAPAPNWTTSIKIDVQAGDFVYMHNYMEWWNYTNATYAGIEMGQFINNYYFGDYFEILHDGLAWEATPSLEAWEQVVITVKDYDNNIMTGFTGTVTLFVAGSFTGPVTWTNTSANDGTLTQAGNGRAEYQFSPLDQGVITLMIKDDSVESIDLSAREATLCQPIIEKNISPQFLNFQEAIFHFNIVHDGAGEMSQWEPVTIEAHHYFNHSILSRYGDQSITLSISKGSGGSISWTNQ